MFLPGCKAFYAVKSVEPYETYVLDLNNLDLAYGATILNDKAPSVGVVKSTKGTKLVLDDVSYIGLESYKNYSNIQPVSYFFEENVPAN